MTPKEYVEAIYEKSQIDDHAARELSYRGILENFIGTFGVKTVNEAKHRDCGAPDITIYNQNQNVIGFIETKDIDDADLDGRKKNKDQFARYKKALGNLLFTDYIDFHFYNGEEFVDAVNIGRLVGDKIVFVPENEEKFLSFIKKFTGAKPQKITSTSKLAEILAHKAQLIRQTILKALSTNGEEKRLFCNQIAFFKRALIHDLDDEKFADIYAQTITYGLFVARMHDNSPETFSRDEAIRLLPSTNPFLQEMFEFMVGRKMRPSLEWIVNDLVSVLGGSDLRSVLKNYGAQQDVVLHFYEDFLTIYDPELRKNLGVFYTPKPVVNFIVRAVDHILQTDFGLSDGIANSDKIVVEKQTKVEGKVQKNNVEVFKTQILDPALGTGTFLSEVIEQVYAKFAHRKAAWQSYVDECLLDRLNGFEYMMSPHTMAHIKLGNLLEETGWQNINGRKRLNVYLTNSLEEGEIADMQLTLFEEAIAKESEMANQIKTNCPVMCVIGNPPYNSKSPNKGNWILKLMKDYKIEPDTKKPLNERNAKWVNDDYVKFLRLAQEYIDKKGEGVVAYITNNGFLDNPTFRGARWSMLKSFDKIYIINLHGSSKKEETTGEGIADENVFKITVGTSINIFVKTKDKKKGDLADVYYTDVYGKQDDKFKYLSNNTLETIEFKKIDFIKPYYMFVPKNDDGFGGYKKGFRVDELMKVGSAGIVTARDKFTIAATESELEERIDKFLNMSDEEARETFKLGKDVRDWSVAMARKDIERKKYKLVNLSYRLFDSRITAYTGVSKGFICMPRDNVMKHFLGKENLGLCILRQYKVGETYQHVFVANQMIESGYVSNKTSEITYEYPLYLYLDGEVVPNLNGEIMGKIEAKAGNVSPEQIFDYVYGVLYSPRYREKFNEFLKIDFPRIPYPKNAAMFNHFSSYGNKLRQLHLMQGVQLNQGWATMNTPGTNEIEKCSYKQGRVYINKEQYFENVPEDAWNFRIGCYQPAQQWLKDRKKPLDYNDIPHYQKIITVLMETKRIMDEIDQKNYFD